MRYFGVFAPNARLRPSVVPVAFPVEKGGFNILFDALPTNGRVLLLPERERTAHEVG